MKTIGLLLVSSTLTLIFSSCSVFKKGEGCPSNGKNVGAEKLLDGNSRKAKKFKA